MNGSKRNDLAGLLADFRLLLYLFVGFRLALGIVYQPYTFDLYEEDGTPAVVERGMSSFGDLRYYYVFARVAAGDGLPDPSLFPIMNNQKLISDLESGHVPYRDFWYEFPPVSILLFSGLYALGSVNGPMDYTAWATITGLILLAFDVGNLILIRRLARRLHGEAAAVALPWCYALLAAGVILPWWTFETLVVFLLLLALTWLLEGRERSSAGITALGVLTKYTPVLILPTVWRFYDRRQAIRYTVITVGITALVFGGLLGWGGRMAQSSLLAQFNKASYQSVWALIDGNMKTGRFGGLDTRFDADAAFEPQGNNPVIPAWVRVIPFAAVGLYLTLRTRRRDDRGVVAFFSVTVVLFFLWAQGWSPQWALTLTPLILLNFPDRTGVLLCLVIGFAGFVEYPALFMRTADTGGAISGSLVPTYVTIILIRTAALVGLAAALARRLTQEEVQ